MSFPRTTELPRPGPAFRVGYDRDGTLNGAWRCFVRRYLPNDQAEISASATTRRTRCVPVADIFADKAACQAEVERRKSQASAQ